MRRLVPPVILIAAAFAMILAGCGSTKPHTNPYPARAAAVIKKTGAAEYFAGNGNPTKILSAKCKGHKSLSCIYTFDFTAPDGNRVQKKAQVPVTCKVSGCKPEWVSGVEIGKTVTLGVDPHSHVARCSKALGAYIKASYGSNTSKRTLLEAEEIVACQDVHNGVYTAPASSFP